MSTQNDDEKEDTSRRPTKAVVGSHRDEEEVFGKVYDRASCAASGAS